MLVSRGTARSQEAARLLQAHSIRLVGTPQMRDMIPGGSHPGPEMGPSPATQAPGSGRLGLLCRPGLNPSEVQLCEPQYMDATKPLAVHQTLAAHCTPGCMEWEL